MARKEKCRRCGKWFTLKFTIEGMGWCPPATYDPSLCDECNMQVEAEEHQNVRRYCAKPQFENR